MAKRRTYHKSRHVNKLALYMTHVNQRGIEQGKAEEHANAKEQSTKSIYAGMCLALWNCLEETDEDEKLEQIATVVNESQELWLRLGDDILEECEKITGLDFRYQERDNNEL